MKNGDKVTIKEYIDQRISNLEKRLDRIETNHLKHLDDKMTKFDDKLESFCKEVNLELRKQATKIGIIATAVSLLLSTLLNIGLGGLL